MRQRTTVVLACLWFTAQAGCSEDGGGGAGGPVQAGSRTSSDAIVIDGSSTVFRISQAANEAYSKIEPGQVIVVNNHGTGGGFSRYLEGEVDMVDASRPATPDEEGQAIARALSWTRFRVGYDGITLVVNPRNTWAKSLTVAQLRSLWQPDSKIKTWKDLDPSWPDQAIVLYSPDNNSGTFDFFTEEIVGKQGSQRDDVQQSSDDNTLVSGVAGDEGALGYFGYAYYAANKDKLRALAVQNGDKAKPVLPSPETILDKSYAPLSRPLFLYVKNASVKRAGVAKFLAYYLANIDELARKGGYNPPTAEDKEGNEVLLTALQGAAGPPASSSTSPASSSTSPAREKD